MKTLNLLKEKWKDKKNPFIISDNNSFFFKDLLDVDTDFLSEIKQGDIIALIGDFDLISIATLFKLIDLGAIVAPITSTTSNDHSYYIETIKAQYVIKDGKIVSKFTKKNDHNLIVSLRLKKQPGLIFFSTGTTGKPKAILHDVSLLFKRFLTPRPSYKTLNFLMFDHMGGINTLLHTIFNGGTIIGTKDRSVRGILNVCQEHSIEVLPTTPTFLRMMLMSGYIPDKIPKSIKIISYGTELMDQPTLNEFCNLLPNIDFKQTYGLSEFCVFRVKSKARDSLFMKIGGEGVSIKKENDMLYIKSDFAMLGYLNAESPFDENGWYNTKDIIKEHDEYIKIIGRNTDILNVGGLKFMKSEVEEVALKYDGIEQVSVYAKQNSITGQHVEIIIECKDNYKIMKSELNKFFNSSLPKHMVPKKIIFNKVEVNHRFKKKMT